MSPEQFVSLILSPLAVFVSPAKEQFVGYWIPAAAIMVYVYHRDRRNGITHGSLLGFLTFWTELRTRSARLDVTVAIINILTFSTLTAAIIRLMEGVPLLTQNFLTAVAGVPPLRLLPEGGPANVVVMLVVALAADFGFFIVHYASHRVPILWEFHKVHHSPRVLNPLTVYRSHPVGVLSSVTGTFLFAGIGIGVGRFVAPDARLLEIEGVALLDAAALAAGALLRHSSVWFHYGRRLNHVFYSPAHHQIHHSEDPRHWNRNFGGTFALWDYLFGTLYVPGPREALSYGLGDEAENLRYTTVAALYLTPFRRSWQRLSRRPDRTSSSPGR